MCEETWYKRAAKIKPVNNSKPSFADLEAHFYLMKIRPDMSDDEIGDIFEQIVRGEDASAGPEQGG